MLTDTEVADAARQALADELAGLTPHEDLLAHVRARYARTSRFRRTAAAAATVVTAGGLATAIIAGTGVPTPGSQRPAAAHRAPGGALAPGQTIVLDGLAIRVKPPLRLSAGSYRHVVATLDGRPTVMTWLLYSGKIPRAASQIGVGTGAAYVLRTASGPSLYVPFQVATQVHYLVLSFGHISESQLVKLAGSITVAGKPGYLRALPRRLRPVTHCPCG